MDASLFWWGSAAILGKVPWKRGGRRKGGKFSHRKIWYRTKFNFFKVFSNKFKVFIFPCKDKLPLELRSSLMGKFSHWKMWNRTKFNFFKVFSNQFKVFIFPYKEKLPLELRSSLMGEFSFSSVKISFLLNYVHHSGENFLIPSQNIGKPLRTAEVSAAEQRRNLLFLWVYNIKT